MAHSRHYSDMLRCYYGSTTVNHRAQLNIIKDIIRSSSMLIIFTSILAYNGTLFLGLAMDDYFNREQYISYPLHIIAMRPEMSRFPIFSILVYPILLRLPLWLSHLLVIATHTTSALFFNRLLRWFNFSDIIALLASILFLTWPSIAEALFWLVASTIVFGTCFVLSGALLMTKRKYLLGSIVICTGLLFSEGLFFPSLYLVFLILLYQKCAYRTISQYVLLIGVLYAIFQFIRLLLTPHGSITQYQIGLDKARQNAVDLLAMSMNMASSYDILWIWSQEPQYKNITLFFDGKFLVLSTLISAGIIFFCFLLIKGYRDVYLRITWKSLLFIILGYLSTLVVFMVVSGNLMQTRYTYTGITYLSLIIALILNSFIYFRHKILKIMGLLCAILLLGWNFYSAWSSIWLNWYTADQVSIRIIADVRDVYKRTGMRHIILVNDPKGVGSAYAISRDWAYVSVGHLYIDPKLELTADSVPNLLSQSDLKFGQQFSQDQCIFLGWNDEHAIASKFARSPDSKFVLNCEHGTLEDALHHIGSDNFLQFTSAPSKEILPSFCRYAGCLKIMNWEK